MSVLPLRLSNNFDSYISGEVTIHPSAVLAPGVILQAILNSKIIIGAGVCIGMGTILQVHEGTLEVEAGANLGAGFLMVGNGKIGANACIGAGTTVFYCSVQPGQVVPPGSILGDTSRQVKMAESSTNQEPGETEPMIRTTQISASAFVEIKDQPPTTSPETSQPEPPNSFGTQIYGQGSVNRLLVTLFPHRQSLSTPNSEPGE